MTKSVENCMYKRHDQLISPALIPPPFPSSCCTVATNERMRNCVYLYNPWSKIWSEQNDDSAFRSK
jgi:hypothetical protein